jgi:hypothetical protein
MQTHDRLRAERDRWEMMQKIGHLRYFVQTTLMWIGGFAATEGVFAFLKSMGLPHVPEMSLIDILMYGGFAGAITSELVWSEMKRKFRIPPPEEDWMTR